MVNTKNSINTKNKITTTSHLNSLTQQTSYDSGNHLLGESGTCFTSLFQKTKSWFVALENGMFQKTMELKIWLSTNSRWSVFHSDLFSLTIVWRSVPVMNFNCPSKMNQLHSEIRINISPFCKLKTFTWHIIIIIDTLVLVIIVQQKRIPDDRLHIVAHL